MFRPFTLLIAIEIEETMVRRLISACVSQPACAFSKGKAVKQQIDKAKIYALSHAMYWVSYCSKCGFIGIIQPVADFCPKCGSPSRGG
jgi:rubrerythrin